MDTNSTKKRTAVVATATAAALLLTGTFAWTLATDDTVLNPFSDEDKGDYNAEIVEQFNPEDPWTEKIVQVKNTADNPVIVRVRFEEFYDLTSRVGSDYDVPEGYLENTEGASAIFTAADLTDSKDPSSTKLAEAITLNFGTGVVTMDEYNTLTDKTTVEWVIDEDGWCYYTKALLAGETTENLLERVDFNEINFNYNQPYDLNYKINVRLQAISADLEDYGAKDNPAQWTNEDYVNDEGITVGGRIIVATDNKYEITSDSNITPQAESLVVGITNTYTNPYANDDGSIAVAVGTESELYAALDDSTVHSILLTNDIAADQTHDYVNYYSVRGDKMIDFGHHTITRNGLNTANAIFKVGKNCTSLVMKHGTIDAQKSSILNYGTKTCDYEFVDMIMTTDTDLSGANCAISVNGTANFYNSQLIYNYSGTATSIKGALTLYGGAGLYMNNSSIESNYNSGVRSTGTGKMGNITLENNSSIKGATEGILLSTNAVLSASDSEISGAVAITENHDRSPIKATLTNTTLTASQLGYFKVGNYPLTMTNCEVNVESANGNKALGLFLRSGDITLDNVNIAVSCGSTGLNSIAGPFVRNDTGQSFDTVDEYYSNITGACTSNYEAIELILNSYESINLKINGGSYTTNVDGAKSVYVFDATGTWNANDTISGQIYETYDWNNSITVTGNPTFSPAFTFENSYTNTTVTQ